MRIRAWWAAALLGLALWTAIAGGAGAAGVPAWAPEEPWRLAIVVDASRELEEAIPGGTRRQLLGQALQVELRSLPLRAGVGLWLSAEGGAQAFLNPGPAAGQKGLELALPAGRGAPDLAPGVRAAGQWLLDRGGGSLLVIASPATPPPPGFPPPGQPLGTAFAHALLLGPRPPAAVWADWALAGSGALFRATEGRHLGRQLHQAAQTALGPARLLVMANDAGNRPLRATYRLLRQDQQAVDQRGISGRPLQILPGLYRVAWPYEGAPAPGPLPERVKVEPTGLTRLWAGGRGTLAIEEAGPRPKGLAWRLTITRLSDGVEVGQGKPPLKATLTAGRYLVSSQTPPQSWSVELGAGEDLALPVGMPGTLALSLPGPAGELRVAYEVVSLLEKRRAGTGYTGQTLRLYPGPYRLEVKLIPPLVRELDLAPEEVKTLALPPAGTLSVQDQEGRPRSYRLRTPEGQLLHAGQGGRPLDLQPGAYLLELAGEAEPRPIRIEPRKATVAP